MPFRIKTTWIFGGGQRGWTESLYSQPSSDQTIVTASNYALQVAQARAPMLGAECYVKAFRCQVVEDAAGLKVTRQGDLTQGLTLYGTPAQGAAEEDVCLLTDFIGAGNLFHKPLYLGGVWDSIVTNFGAYNPSPAWITLFGSWKAKVLSLGYGWVSRTSSAPYAVSNYTQEDTGFVTLTFGGTPFAGASNTPVTVRISGLPSVGGMSTLNGDLIVRPTGVSTAVTVTRIAVMPFVGPGVMHTFTYQFRMAGDIGAEKIVTRERGAPLLESRGRRRVRSRT